MRLFIAAPLPNQIGRNLSKVKSSFADFPAKWVEERNLHITLVFIGDIKPDPNLPTQYHTLAYKTDHRSQKLGERNYRGLIVKGMTKFPPIKLKIDGLMLFPNEKKARLLTAKLGGETGKLTTLVKKIKNELRARRVGFDEKPFHPHITLARFKHLRSSERRALKDRVRTIGINPTGLRTSTRRVAQAADFTVGQIELLESKLTPTGPVYKSLKIVSSDKGMLE